MSLLPYFAIYIQKITSMFDSLCFPIKITNVQLVTSGWLDKTGKWNCLLEFLL